MGRCISGLVALFAVRRRATPVARERAPTGVFAGGRAMSVKQAKRPRLHSSEQTETVRLRRSPLVGSASLKLAAMALHPGLNRMVKE